MLIALLLLCVFFSIVTWTRHYPQNADAAKDVAAQIAPRAKVLIVVRPTAADSAFAAALSTQLGSRAELVQGEPKEARAALVRAAAAGGMDVIACNHATASWLVFADLVHDFPALKETRVVQPRPQAWPVFLKTDNLLNIANQIAVIAILAIGMTLVGVSIAVWSSLRSQTACTEDEGGLGGEDCRAALEHSPPHCTNPVWLRSGRVAGPAALATRSVQRQGV